MPASTNEPLPVSIPYELRIGVTGHCEVSDPPALEAAVRATIQTHIIGVLESAAAEPFGPHGSPTATRDLLFRALTAILAPATAVLCPALAWMTNALAVPLSWPVVPHSPRVPPAKRRTPLDLTVVTSLAPGSDQIVARAVSSCVRCPEQRNRYLEAVLPFSPDLYEEELEREEDRAAFRDLLAKDQGRLKTHVEPTVLHPDFPNVPDPDEPQRLLPRSKAFRDAGLHVVDSSEIVLAIWDPEHAPRPGGTEESVRFAVDKGRVVLWLDPTRLERGARRLRPLPEGAPAAPGAPPGFVAEPPPTRAKELSANFHRLAAYNRDEAWDATAYRQILDREKARLDRATEVSALPKEAVAGVEREVLLHFARADQLAGRYHALRNFVSILLPTLSALAVAGIAFQILFLPRFHTLAIGEILLILVGFLSYRLSVREAWHEKWLNDRHLAERLRAFVYTFSLEPRSSDGERSPEGAGQNLLPFYRPTNEWFVGTLSRLEGRLQRDRPDDFKPAAHAAGLAAFVRYGWVEQQVHYYENVRDREASARRRSRLVTVVTLVSILVVAAAHAFGVGHGDGEVSADPLRRPDLWIAFLTIAIPACGGAFQAVDALNDHPRMEERAGRMAVLLAGVSDQLRKVETLSALEVLVQDTRRIIELEGHDFAESMRGREPEYHG